MIYTTAFEPPPHLIDEFLNPESLRLIEDSTGVRLKYDRYMMHIFSKPQIAIESDSIVKNEAAKVLLTKRSKTLKLEYPIDMNEIDSFWKQIANPSPNNLISNTFLMIDGPYLFTSLHNLSKYSKENKDCMLDIPNFTRKIESLVPFSNNKFYSKSIVGAVRVGKYEYEQGLPYKKFYENGYHSWVTKLIPTITNEKSYKVFNDDVYAIAQLQQFQNIVLHKKLRGDNSPCCIMLLTGDGNINNSYSTNGLSFITTINLFLQMDNCKVRMIGFSDNLSKQYVYFQENYPDKFDIVSLDNLVSDFLIYKPKKIFVEQYRLKISSIPADIVLEDLKYIFGPLNIDLKPVSLKTGKKWCVFIFTDRNERNVVYERFNNTYHIVNCKEFLIKFDDFQNN